MRLVPDAKEKESEKQIHNTLRNSICNWIVSFGSSFTVHCSGASPFYLTSTVSALLCFLLCTVIFCYILCVCSFVLRHTPVVRVPKSQANCAVQRVPYIMKASASSYFLQLSSSRKCFSIMRNNLPWLFSLEMLVSKFWRSLISHPSARHY